MIVSGMFDSDFVLTTASSKTAVPVPDSDSNEHWQHSLNTLERELAAYRTATSASSGATEEERAEAAARVAAAVRWAQVVPSASSADGSAELTMDLPPIYQPAASPSQFTAYSAPLPTRAPPNVLQRSTLGLDAHGASALHNVNSTITPMLDPSSSSDTSSPSERGESPGKQILRGGALMIVAAPLAATGMAFYTCGLAIEGMAIMLKGMGTIGKKPLKDVMKSKKRSRQ